MDQQQQQHHHGIADDHHPIAAASYGFYSAEQDPSYNLAYNPQMGPYQVVQHTGPQTRGFSTITY